jgi:hypothetical protein
VTTGATFTSGTHYTVTNVPVGLTAVITKVSSTTATIGLTGNAAAHANSNDIANISITFTNAAFTSGSAVGIVGSTQTGIILNFADPANPTSISVGATQIGLEDDGTYDEVQFTVMLDEPATSTVTFDYSLTGGANPLATSGVDFSVPGTTDSIAIGTDSKVITIPLLTDALSE